MVCFLDLVLFLICALYPPSGAQGVRECRRGDQDWCWKGRRNIWDEQSGAGPGRCQPEGRVGTERGCPGTGWVKAGWALQGGTGAHRLLLLLSRSSVQALPSEQSGPSILQTLALRKAARSSVSIDVDITTNRHLGTGKN